MGHQLPWTHRHFFHVSLTVLKSTRNVLQVDQYLSSGDSSEHLHPQQHTSIRSIRKPLKSGHVLLIHSQDTGPGLCERGHAAPPPPIRRDTRPSCHMFLELRSCWPSSLDFNHEANAGQRSAETCCLRTRTHTHTKPEHWILLLDPVEQMNVTLFGRKQSSPPAPTHLVWLPLPAGRSAEPGNALRHTALRSAPPLRTAGRTCSTTRCHTRRGRVSDHAHRTC